MTENDNIWPWYNAAALSLDELAALRVDREEELSRCLSALIQNRQNVLLFGERGIGKTFFARLLLDAVQGKNEGLLPVFANMTGLSAYAPSGVAAFPRAILLQICSHVWRELAGHSYLDLRETLGKSPTALSLQSKAEQTIQRLYALLMRSDIRAQYETSASVGFSAALKGDKGERRRTEFQQSDILPFEFFEFAEELHANVLPTYNKSRIIAICDEANLLPLFQQEDILTRYLELFALKRISFVFVAGHWAWERVPNLPAAFEEQVELKGLDSSAIESLICKATAKVQPRPPAALVHALDEGFSGHPRFTLNALRRSYELLWSKQLKEFSDSLIARAVETTKRMVEQERMSMWKPTNG